MIILMNKAFLIGRLTRDPEVRYTTTNIACAEFDIAINNGKDSDGNERQADFIRVAIWDKQAENVAKYTKKGSQVAVEGSIKTKSWDGDDGNKHYKTYVNANRIMFLDSKKSKEPLPETPDYLNNNNQNKTQDPFEQFGQEIEINEEDIPF